MPQSAMDPYLVQAAATLEQALNDIDKAAKDNSTPGLTDFSFDAAQLNNKHKSIEKNKRILILYQSIHQFLVQRKKIDNEKLFLKFKGLLDELVELQKNDKDTFQKLLQQTVIKRAVLYLFYLDYFESYNNHHPLITFKPENYYFSLGMAIVNSTTQLMSRKLLVDYANLEVTTNKHVLDEHPVFDEEEYKYKLTLAATLKKQNKKIRAIGNCINMLPDIDTATELPEGMRLYIKYKLVFLCLDTIESYVKTDEKKEALMHILVAKLNLIEQVPESITALYCTLWWQLNNSNYIHHIYTKGGTNQSIIIIKLGLLVFRHYQQIQQTPHLPATNKNFTDIVFTLTHCVINHYKSNQTLFFKENDLFDDKAFWKTCATAIVNTANTAQMVSAWSRSLVNINSGLMQLGQFQDALAVLNKLIPQADSFNPYEKIYLQAHQCLHQNLQLLNQSGHLALLGKIDNISAIFINNEPIRISYENALTNILLQAIAFDVKENQKGRLEELHDIYDKQGNDEIRSLKIELNALYAPIHTLLSLTPSKKNEVKLQEAVNQDNDFSCLRMLFIKRNIPANETLRKTLIEHLKKQAATFFKNYAKPDIETHKRLLMLYQYAIPFLNSIGATENERSELKSAFKIDEYQKGQEEQRVKIEKALLADGNRDYQVGSNGSKNNGRKIKGKKGKRKKTAYKKPVKAISNDAPAGESENSSDDKPASTASLRQASDDGETETMISAPAPSSVITKTPLLPVKKKKKRRKKKKSNSARGAMPASPFKITEPGGGPVAKKNEPPRSNKQQKLKAFPSSQLTTVKTTVVEQKSQHDDERQQVSVLGLTPSLGERNTVVSMICTSSRTRGQSEPTGRSAQAVSHHPQHYSTPTFFGHSYRTTSHLPHQMPVTALRDTIDREQLPIPLLQLSALVQQKFAQPLILTGRALASLYLNETVKNDYDCVCQQRSLTDLQTCFKDAGFDEGQIRGSEHPVLTLTLQQGEGLPPIEVDISAVDNLEQDARNRDLLATTMQLPLVNANENELVIIDSLGARQLLANHQIEINPFLGTLIFKNDPIRLLRLVKATLDNPTFSYGPSLQHILWQLNDTPLGHTKLWQKYIGNSSQSAGKANRGRINTALNSLFNRSFREFENTTRVLHKMHELGILSSLTGIVNTQCEQLIYTVEKLVGNSNIDAKYAFFLATTALLSFREKTTPQAVEVEYTPFYQMMHLEGQQNAEIVAIVDYYKENKPIDRIQLPHAYLVVSIMDMLNDRQIEEAPRTYLFI